MKILDNFIILLEICMLKCTWTLQSHLIYTAWKMWVHFIRIGPIFQMAPLHMSSQNWGMWERSVYFNYQEIESKPTLLKFLDAMCSIVLLGTTDIVKILQMRLVSKEVLTQQNLFKYFLFILFCFVNNP